MFTIDLSENKVLGAAYRQGLEEGRKSQLAMLQEQIEQRLRSLPDWVEQKLSQSCTDELRVVGRSVLNAVSFEDLFLWWPNGRIPVSPAHSHSSSSVLVCSKRRARFLICLHERSDSLCSLLRVKGPKRYSICCRNMSSIPSRQPSS